MSERVFTDEEVRAVMPHVLLRLDGLERQISEHVQKFDTLETRWWKRWYWYFIHGWPLHLLNADRPNWRMTNPRRSIR